MAATEARRRTALGALAGVSAVVLLTGCTGTGPESGEPAPGLGPAERVASVLQGRYAGRDRGSGADAPVVRVSASVERVTSEGVHVRLEQRSGSAAARAFRLVLGPTRVATRLPGRFAPLDERGAASAACPVSVTVRSDGFVASTEAATCRFGQGDAARALVKEIAHDGSRLVIADRIVDAASGEAMGPDRVLELSRVRAFTGWAGVREADGGAWRVATSLALSSDGQAHRPVDAAGAPLGFVVELAPHRIRDEQPPVLRLRVFDDASGELLAQSWADPDAARLGVALSGLQVGLRAARGPERRSAERVGLD